MIRIGFIGCVEFSQRAFELLISLQRRMPFELVALVTKPASKFNADFADLRPSAERAGMPVLDYDRDDAAVLSFMTDARVDVIYCFGWSHLLPEALLASSRLGVVGFHPAALPHNRGRHPIIWALALGLSETASTFFLMDGGADTGPIISQESIAISDEDDARTLYDKVTDVALRQITEFTAAMCAGSLTAKPQKSGEGNVWRKRSAADGRIDWRMSSRSIRNQVRALTRPYVGAHVDLPGGGTAQVWRVSEQPGAPANAEPGKVLRLEGRRILVKCGDASSIWLEEHEFDVLPEIESYL